MDISIAHSAAWSAIGRKPHPLAATIRA